MVVRVRPKDDSGTGGGQVRKRTRPAKGTGANLLGLVGAWSYMTPEEIEQIRRDIVGSRKSAK